MISTVVRLQKSMFGRWVIKLTVAAVLIGIGYQLPQIWLSLCLVIWAAYTLTLIVAVYFIKEKKEPFKAILSFLANISIAALASAVVVFLHLYRMAYDR